MNSFFRIICARYVALEFWPITRPGLLIRDLQIGNENDYKQWSDSASGAWSGPAPVMNDKTFSHPHHHLGTSSPRPLRHKNSDGSRCSQWAPGPGVTLRRRGLAGDKGGLWELIQIWLLNYWVIENRRTKSHPLERGLWDRKPNFHIYSTTGCLV